MKLKETILPLAIASTIAISTHAVIMRVGELTESDRVNPPPISVLTPTPTPAIYNPEPVWNTATRAKEPVLDLNEETITFIKNNKVVGQITWSTGKLYFSGSAHECGQSFFNNYMKPQVDEYIHSFTEEQLKAINVSHTKKKARKR